MRNVRRSRHSGALLPEHLGRRLAIIESLAQEITLEAERLQRRPEPSVDEEREEQ